AGLLDQERPNIFAQRVANLSPGERIQVVISMDHEVRCEGSQCEYLFPTVVGPRFIPARQNAPGAIDPPVVAPGQRTQQRFTLALDLEAGVPIQALESPSHAISTVKQGRGVQRISLSGGATEILNRDFRLRWQVGDEKPEVAVMAWRDPRRSADPGVFTLILQPPVHPSEEEAAPRELVFVLDCSGSMMGVPLEAAKNVVRRALGSVRPQDTFQIIRFSDSTSGLGSRPLPATRENLHRALAFLDSLHGEGGTEMIAGIRAALGFPADPERLRIVAFLTDGYIGNEREILAEVRRLIGSARLFSFGIGSSVNRYLLEGLAEEGRGEAAFLGPRETPDQMVQRFAQRISSPLLTDVRITWRDVEVMDQLPERVPDLFAGQPLILRGRYRRPGTGVVEVEGFSRGRRQIYRNVVSLPSAAEDHEALGRLWARARIHQLERELHDGERPEAVETITSLGLRHRLMTAYTSLVAVDSEISNWTGRSSPVSVPVEMPEDVSYEGIFGAANQAKSKIYPASTTVPPGAELSALGYVGTRKDTKPVVPGLSQDGSKVELATPRDERDAEPPPAFTRLTLFQTAGQGWVFQGDGQLLRIAGGRTVYVKTLAEQDLELIRKALTAARTDQWVGGGAGPRIVLEMKAMSRVVGLPSGNAAVEALAALLRTLTECGGSS
ncbi:MAG: VIT and VWA domain-containing protein, partial [Acidobacteria bacterium]|nr:VIT and VWA domain-containing protein [Acidobacteriota bacterium]